MTTSSLITQWAEAARRFVNQAGEIVLQINTQINDETFTTEKWAKASQQLVNLTLTTGLEMPQIPCPAGTADPRDLSDFIDVEPDGQYQRALSVAAPFAQDGAPSCVIPGNSIFFVPGVVRVHATSFRLGVNWPNLRSGTYRGRIRMTQIGCDTSQSVEKDVVIDL
ncbi:hypothetical protein PT015_02420 [Candidatus Mycobacterium wuenschmannii]|uniref:Uncharacterized protein n=1 Tax=Candidatus Mycobacterium wuenschmannii TaxID=3027808 RepID=A0ABY8VYL6_9MYCO|nr:hypothetical protein [Candidatus Mycobacterium wuenschmannii]WIM88381.1 hypothetical protein PT015_02420 [Candidatus Mycobacterium wuenschmannii]